MPKPIDFYCVDTSIVSIAGKSFVFVVLVLWHWALCDFDFFKKNTFIQLNPNPYHCENICNMDPHCSGNAHSMLNFNVCNCMDPCETNFNYVALSVLERGRQQQVSASLPSNWDLITCLRCFAPSLFPPVTSLLSAFHRQAPQLLGCHLYSL